MKKWPIVICVVAFAGFGAGLVHLFSLRFEAGDNYPPYSSLRTDPLGAKALYESIDPLVPARRNLQPLSKMGEGRQTTLFWLGEDLRKLRLSEDDYKHLETFIRTGGRLVLAAFPVPKKPLASSFVPPGQRRRGFVPGPTNAPPAGEDLDRHSVSITEQWNLALGYTNLPGGAGGTSAGAHVPAFASLRLAAPSPALPPTLRVHTALHFDKLDSEWEVVYARRETTNEYPVMIERFLGKGSIVLAADSFPFSNEALLSDRQSGLLTWLVGSGRHVIFDETHLGVQTDPGVAALARQYRLHGLAAGLLILAALFIWKNAASFVPPIGEQLARERGDWIAGRESSAGFVNLLRRHIAPSQLMKVCLEQWNAHVAALRKPAPAKLAAMQKIIDAENTLDPSQRHPVRTYRKFCEILSRKT